MKTTVFLLALILAFINLSHSQGTPNIHLCGGDCSTITTPVCGHLPHCPRLGPCSKTYANACDACDAGVDSYIGGACPAKVYCNSKNADTAAGSDNYVCAYFWVNRCSSTQKYQQMVGGKTACSNPKVKYYTVGKCIFA